MRQACLNTIHEMARADGRVIFIGSDIARGTLEGFRQEMPERFFMEGVSEAHIVGMMAGLAMNGRIPYLNTIASFITRRCYEQIALDACLHRFNLRLIGSGGGLVYGPLGPTHLATEDLAILRALPGMAVVAVADAEEMKHLMRATLTWEGPVYIRLAKGGDPVVTASNPPFAIGRAVPMRPGTDALLVTTGVLLKPALDAAAGLEARGISAGVLHVHTVKPLDTATLLQCMASVRVVVTAEEHSIIGGLGSAVAEVLAEAGLSPVRRFARLGIPDVFPDHYGSQAELMELYGITRQAMEERVVRLLEASSPAPCRA